MYGVPSGAGRSEAPTTPEPPTSDADMTGGIVVDAGRPHERRMSDASLLGGIVLALVSAGFLVALALVVIASIICSQPGEWC
jgi:hypothetical protein